MQPDVEFFNQDGVPQPADEAINETTTLSSENMALLEENQRLQQQMHVNFSVHRAIVI